MGKYHTRTCFRDLGARPKLLEFRDWDAVADTSRKVREACYATATTTFGVTLELA